MTCPGTTNDHKTLSRYWVTKYMPCKSSHACNLIKQKKKIRATNAKITHLLISMAFIYQPLLTST